MPTTRSQRAMQSPITTQPQVSNYTDCSYCGELTIRPQGADLSIQVLCKNCLPLSSPTPLSSLGQVFIPFPANPAGQICMFQRWQEHP